MTNVFRGPKEAIHLTSILDRFYLERTRLPFSCDEYHMRWYGSSMDQVEIAIYEFRPAIACLSGCVKFQSDTDEVRVRRTFNLI